MPSFSVETNPQATTQLQGSGAVITSVQLGNAIGAPNHWVVRKIRQYQSELEAIGELKFELIQKLDIRGKPTKPTRVYTLSVEQCSWLVGTFNRLSSIQVRQLAAIGLKAQVGIEDEPPPPPRQSVNPDYLRKHRLREMCHAVGITPEIYDRYIVLSRNNISLYLGDIDGAINYITKRDYLKHGQINL